MRRKNTIRGFTLLEVLIAVLIVGIIATAALPLLGSYTEKAREAREAANMVVKSQAIDRYVADHKVGLGMVYDASDDTVTTYGLETMQGPTAQLLLPTDVNGNVMGDPVAASPGPYSYGPYLAELPPEPASLLLATNEAVRLHPSQAKVFSVETLLFAADVEETTTGKVLKIHVKPHKATTPIVAGTALKRGIQDMASGFVVASIHPMPGLDGQTGFNLIKVLEAIREGIAAKNPKAAGRLEAAIENAATHLVKKEELEAAILRDQVMVRAAKKAKWISEVHPDELGKVYGYAFVVQRDLEWLQVEAQRPFASPGTQKLARIAPHYIKVRGAHEWQRLAMPGAAEAAAAAEKEFKAAWNELGVVGEAGKLLTQSESLFDAYPEMKSRASDYVMVAAPHPGWDIILPPDRNVLKLVEDTGQSTIAMKGILEEAERILGMEKTPVNWQRFAGEVSAEVANAYHKLDPASVDLEDFIERGKKQVVVRQAGVKTIHNKLQRLMLPCFLLPRGLLESGSTQAIEGYLGGRANRYTTGSAHNPGLWGVKFQPLVKTFEDVITS